MVICPFVVRELNNININTHILIRIKIQFYWLASNKFITYDRCSLEDNNEGKNYYIMEAGEFVRKITKLLKETLVND
jgi:hypothetical protein